MPITMYQTGKWTSGIVHVECTRVTESSVFLMSKSRGCERREARTSEYSRYHDSEAAAVAYLRGRLTSNVRVAEKTLDKAIAELSAFVSRYGPGE